ncbi:MAG TPA: YidC/Oxa1 family membrane protein insertase [Acidimicrobiales bacterium]|nr:YidC/Oxa1 family membrane protein insertase [Acidimicrobiales bacterium]
MFQLLGGALAFFYALIPNYAVAIALLTLSVMLLLSPLTLKSTRSMLAMQKLQPEMKALQTKYKGGDRQKLNEEMMALYKEHKVNPVAGCLPMLLQMPVFLVMYRVIRGLTHKTGEVASPQYLNEKSDLYRALVKSGGRMKSFGIDLANSASDKHSSFGKALPFFVVVALVVLTQYVQTRQTMARNTKAASSQQQVLLKVMPGFFGLISLSIPAAVNVYFLVSALFRVSQTAAMYRFDPTLAAHAEKHAREVEARSIEVNPKSAKKPAPGSSPAGRKSIDSGGKGGGRATGRVGGNGTKPGTNQAGQPKGNGRRPPPRPQQKRRSKKGR